MKTYSYPSLIFCISLLLSCATFTFSSGEVIFRDGLKNYHELKLPNVSGPESLAFDCNGEGPYVGVSDGRILKWKGSHKGWVEFAVPSPHRDRKLCDGSTDPNKEPRCGRPLGLKFDTRTCNLYIADAYFGLLRVGPGGGVAKQLAISADGVPFRFLNGLDVEERTGVVYFSDSSSVYQRREGLKILQSGEKTGRLLKYEAKSKSKKVQVLLQRLAFPNGVALSKDGSFLLLSDSISRTILKFWLKGSKAFTSQLFAQFERLPDNIKRNGMGDFWVGLNSNRTTSSNGSLKNQTQVPWRKEEDPVGVKFDEKGKTLEVLDGRGGQELESVSEVEQHNGNLWIGSASKDYVVHVKV